MLDKTTIRPYHSGDAQALMDFLKHAHFLLGDDDFTPGKTSVLDFLFSERGEILGLLEAEVCTVSSLSHVSPALLVDKVALFRGYEDEEFVGALLGYLKGQAIGLDVDYIFLNGEELPFERELGFTPSAPVGIYDEIDPEGNLKTLRFLPIREPKIIPGFFHKL